MVILDDIFFKGYHDWGSEWWSLVAEGVWAIVHCYHNKTHACCKTFPEHWVTWDFPFRCGFRVFLTVARHKSDISAEPGLWRLSWRTKLTLSKWRNASPSSRNCPSLLWILLFQQHWNLRQEMDKSTALSSLDCSSPNDKGCKHLKLCYKETFQPITDSSALRPPHRRKTLS